MARKFQIKRGPLANIPTLAPGEFGMATNTDSERLFIGTGLKNLAVPFLRDLTPEELKMLPTTLKDDHVLKVERGDHAHITNNIDSYVPNVPAVSNFVHIITLDATGRVETSLSIPLDYTDKVYYYSFARGEWLQIATTDYVVPKDGDTTVSGTLTMRSLKVTDGYMNGSVSTDGTTSRVQLLSSNPSNGKSGAILVGPDGVSFMDGNGYEYRVIHEGNMAQFLGVAPATIE